ncbi:MAG: GAF domain-containing protein [Magnetococcales bacterium]|nr:GAF domain-containing protein [Magnetococcales bacterium]
MVRHLPFRRKVSLFFLLILAAFAVNAVQAVMHYNANMASWQQDHLTRKTSQLIHEIEIKADHAHHEVEYFLRTKDPEAGDRVQGSLQEILPRLRELGGLGVMPEERSLEQVRIQVEGLLETFLQIRKRVSEIGLNENSGEHGRIREEIHRVEELLSEKQTFEALASMLQLRRHEKDFMERRQIRYLEKFNAEVERFYDLVNRSGLLLADERQDVKSQFANYLHGFYTIASELLAVAQLTEKYRVRVVETEGAMRELVATLDAVFMAHDARQSDLLFDQFLRSQVTVFLVLLGIGVLLAWFQYDLLRAVNDVSATARRVAAGEQPEILVERRDEIGELTRSLKVMQEGLTGRHRELETTVRELKASERENARALDLRSAISSILQYSLLPQTLEEILGQALEIVLAIPWLRVERRGAIFLYNDMTGRLEMAVQHDLSPRLLELCRSIPLGHCLCGRAAALREVVMSHDLDARHETRFEGMAPHGHYCLPIVSDRRLLGVLNVYLAEGHLFDDDEAQFLTNIANTLAGLISRRQAERKLTQLLATLDAKVVERTRTLNEKILELENTRNELIEKEKLASLGRLVAGIAHEVNTPVGVAYAAATQISEESRVVMALLEREEVDVDELLTRLAIVDEASLLVARNLQRAAELIRSFKRASIDQSSEAVRDYLVAEVARDVLMSLRNAFKKTAIEIDLECPEELRVVGIPGYLNQILTNLLLNSLMHGFEEGRRAGRIGLRFVLREGDLLDFVYADTGVGMSGEARSRAFEPFFTTNRGSGGSGLGLYICYNLITTKLRGSITLASGPDQGVRFECRWPVQLKSAQIT